MQPIRDGRHRRMTYANSKLSYHFYEGTRTDISPAVA